MNNVRELLTMSDNERKAIVQNGMALLKQSETLAEDRRACLFNGGWYDNSIKGYLIVSACYAGLSGDTIDKLLYAFRLSLADYSRDDAEKLYLDSIDSLNMSF